MEKYFSIGEVVRMKNVSHRSLRYYDKLGILVPAYVNEETGYRYYSVQQLIVLDIISVCIELGIALKNLEKYIDKDNIIKSELLLNDGKEIALQKKKRIDNIITTLDIVAEHFNTVDELLAKKGRYKKFFPQRYYVIKKIKEDKRNFFEYLKKLTEIESFIKQNQLTRALYQGALQVEKGMKNDFYAFMQILKPEIENENIIVLPEGEYTCEIFPLSDVERAEKEYFSVKRDKYIVFAEIYAKENKIEEKPPFELQQILL